MIADLHVHECECGKLDRCTYCGCCQHCTQACPCKVQDAPYGMSCPCGDCGCVGRS